MTLPQPVRARGPIAIGLLMGALTSTSLAALSIAVETSHAVLAVGIATPYLAFAAVDGRAHSLVLETAAAAAFFVTALHLVDGPAVAVALILSVHAGWDVLHVRHDITRGTGWWPPWCAGFDLAAAGGLVIIDRWLS